MYEIITVQKHEELTPNHIKSNVAGVGSTSVLHMHDPETAVTAGIGIQYCPTCITASVVHT